jgi:hypothetical protein
MEKRAIQKAEGRLLLRLDTRRFPVDTCLSLDEEGRVSWEGGCRSFVAGCRDGAIRLAGGGRSALRAGADPIWAPRRR